MDELQTNVHEHTFHGTRAVTLTAGRYRATALPELGGNLIAFEETDRRLNFLHTPKDLATYNQRPVVYGMPVLFPPNRYEDGTFTVNGRTYHFPINEEKTHNHIHGFLKDTPWDVTRQGTTKDSAYIEMTHRLNPDDDAFRYFPHEFTISITYTLSAEGLAQNVRVVNHGEHRMPMMLGFHTSLNAPFADGSTANDYTFKITVGERWELTERQLPTWQFQALDDAEQQMRETGVSPVFEELDNHYTVVPQGGRNYAELTDRRLGIRLIYEPGLEYKQWMLFNNFAKGGFICPEPMTSVVNAPNCPLPQAESGLLTLMQGEVWTAESRFVVQDI